MTPFAHSPRPGSDWSEAHPLAEHLVAVADIARQAAQPFDAGDLAWLAGLWHDLGKYRPAFQQYIRGVQGLEKSHKLAGSVLASKTKSGVGEMITLAIAGHHSGLPRVSGEHPSLDTQRCRS